jgi:hypothetical protein
MLGGKRRSKRWSPFINEMLAWWNWCGLFLWLTSLLSSTKLSLVLVVDEELILRFNDGHRSRLLLFS